MKRCTGCGEEKPATREFFDGNKGCRDGLNPRCKSCIKTARRAHYEANKEKINAKNRDYYKANKEKSATTNKLWAENNKERVRASRRAYYEANKDTVKLRAKLHKQATKQARREAQERWERENPEEVARLAEEKRLAREQRREKEKAYKRKHYAANADKARKRAADWLINNRERARKTRRDFAARNREYVNARQRITTVRRRARIRGLPDTLTQSQWEDALLYFNGCCAICGKRPDPEKGQNLAADHWIPLASPDCLGTTFQNIVPLCHGNDGCNPQKADKHPFEWLSRKYDPQVATVHMLRIRTYFNAVLAL